MILTELQNFGDYIGFVIDGILQIFNQLANIEFLGTNMLRFSLMILIFGTAIPILFSLTNFRIIGTTQKEHNDFVRWQKRELGKKDTIWVSTYDGRGKIYK